MFAIAAAIVFALALFGVHVGILNLVTLGLLLLAVHLALGGVSLWPRNKA